MEPDELSGRITGRLGYNYRRPHSSSVMTAGRLELLEDGHRSYFRRGRRTFRGTTGRTEQRAD